MSPTTLTQQSLDAFLCLYAHACEQDRLASQQEAGDDLLALLSACGTLWADLSTQLKQWKDRDQMRPPHEPLPWQHSAPCISATLLTQAMRYEAEGRKQYQRACQHHRQGLPFQSASHQEACIRLMTQAMQAWVAVGVHLQQSREREQDAAERVSSLLLAGREQQRLCLLLALLQHTLTRYCQAFLLVPTLIEEDEEEEDREVHRR